MTHLVYEKKKYKLESENLDNLIILLGGNQVSKLPKLEVTDYYENMTLDNLISFCDFSEQLFTIISKGYLKYLSKF